MAGVLVLAVGVCLSGALALVVWLTHPRPPGKAAVSAAPVHAAGARRIWSPPYSLEVQAGQHQAGTCRMGNDPAGSVTDPWGRVHGHDNLWIMDASVLVTNGGFNPVLTIMALALRSARRLAR